MIMIALLPISVRYTVLVRKDPEKNRHLLKRIYGALFISMPVFFISSTRVNKLYDEYSAKYLSDLSDSELMNFNKIYK